MATTTKKASAAAPAKTTTKTETAVKETVDVKALQEQNKLLQEQNSKFAEQNAKLEGQLDMLTKMFMEMKNGSAVAPVQTAPTSRLDKTVTLVHLIENAPEITTHMDLSNTVIDLNAFGEERTLTMAQAEELAGKYRKFFEKGFIAFGSDAEDLARSFGLKSIKDYAYYSKDFVQKLGSLNVTELENLWYKLSQGHKDFVIHYFKRKIAEKDPAFNNIHKIELLNRISGGAMSNTLLDYQTEQDKKQMAKNNNNN